MSTRTIDLLTVRVGAEMHEVLTGFDKIATRAEKLGRSMTRVGRNLTMGISLPIAGIGAAAVKMASDAEEASNKFDVVMRGSVDAVRQRLEKLAETIPLTTAEMEGMAAGIQDMLVPMGVARKEAAGLSGDAIELAGDLASFNDALPVDVLEAMRSALAGSSEPMLRYGVDTRVARLEALALEAGLIKQGEALTNAARAQAVMLAIQQDSTDAIGDAARTVDSTANSMKFFARDIKQLGINIGQVLIPMVRPLINRANDFLKVLTSLNPETLKTVVTIGALAAAAGPALIVLGQLAIAFKTLTVAAIAFNAVLLKGGIAAMIAGGGLVLALAAAAGGAVWMAKKLRELNTELDNTSEKASTTALNINLLAAMRPDLFEQLPDHMKNTATATEEVADTATALLIPAVGAANEGLLRMHSVELPAVNAALPLLSGNIETAGEAAGESVDEFRRLKDAIGDIALQGVDAFVDFASGAGGAIKSFVSDALKQLAKLLARMLVIKAIMSFLPGVGNFLGFDRFAGGFATGGHIPAGQFGLVAEAGQPEMISSPSFVQGPANVTPMSEAGGTTVLQFPAPRSSFERMAQDYLAEGLRQLEHSGFKVRTT